MEDDSGHLEFVKKVKHPQIKNSLLNSYVYIDILPRGLFKKVTVKTQEVQYIRPFTNYSDEKQNKIIKTHDFNKRAFFQYLFRYFNKEPIKIPDKLLKRIEVYNTKQKKHKKKIIAGRDF